MKLKLQLQEFLDYWDILLCPGKTFAGTVKQEFANFTHKALNQFVREQINNLLDVTTPSPISTPTLAIEVVKEPESDPTKQVITTEEEAIANKPLYPQFTPLQAQACSVK